MNLSVSNIAWKKEWEKETLSILSKLGILGIEVAPTTFFDDPMDAQESDILELKNNYKEKGFGIVAMQSLLFKAKPVSIFAGEEELKYILDYLKKITRIASILGAKKLVFGSPKNRLVGTGQNYYDYRKIAEDFFNKLSVIAGENDVIICLEAVAKEYGGNFVNKTEEALEWVKNINHPNFKVNFDTSTMILNGENFMDIAKLAKGYVGHVHISAPMLGEILELDHQKIKEAILLLDYDDFISLEMKAPTDVVILEKNIENFSKNYI